MGKVLGAYLFPHPPIILEEIGKGEETKAKNTIEGAKTLSIDIKKKSPSTIIILQELCEKPIPSGVGWIAFL